MWWMVAVDCCASHPDRSNTKNYSASFRAHIAAVLVQTAQPIASSYRAHVQLSQVARMTLLGGSHTCNPMAARHLSNAAACCSQPFAQRHIARTFTSTRCNASIRDVHDQLAAGTTVTSIVERYLTTARNMQHLGAFLHVAEEHALQQVRATRPRNSKWLVHRIDNTGARPRRPHGC